MFILKPIKQNIEMKTKASPKSKKVKFETYQVADLSTKYITKEDGLLIGEKDAPGHVGSVDPAVPSEGSPGDFFAVQSDDEVFRKQLADLKKFGFSEHFLHIFETLHAQGIPYVRLDGDGGEADGLPFFDW